MIIDTNIWCYTLATPHTYAEITCEKCDRYRKKTRRFFELIKFHWPFSVSFWFLIIWVFGVLTRRFVSHRTHPFHTTSEKARVFLSYTLYNLRDEFSSIFAKFFNGLIYFSIFFCFFALHIVVLIFFFDFLQILSIFSKKFSDKLFEYCNYHQ